MKAAVLEDKGKLTLKHVPMPEVVPGSVLIRVKACSICATDVRTYRHGRGSLGYPAILGHEIAGEIVGKGFGVKDYNLGQKVAVTPRVACGQCFYCRKGEPQYCEKHVSFGGALPGGFAEYMLVPRRAVEYGSIISLPDAVGLSEASLAEPLSCCIRAQNYASVSPGDTVAVIGGGPMGVLHTRLARVNGAGKIILADRHIDRLSKAYLDAVDTLIDVTVSDAGANILKETGNRGADVVIIACSSREAQQESLSYTNYGGRIAFFSGLAPGEPPTELNSNVLHYREIQVSGTHGSLPAELDKAVRLIAGKQVKVDDLITGTISLDEVPDAFKNAGSHRGMKTVVCP